MLAVERLCSLPCLLCTHLRMHQLALNWLIRVVRGIIYSLTLYFGITPADFLMAYVTSTSAGVMLLQHGYANIYAMSRGIEQE